MKLLLGLAFLSLASATLSAAETAYTALRTVGKQRGADALNRVLEVRGRAGAPEPQVWKVVLSDPAARNGVRELDVQRGKIIAERTPSSGPSSQPIDFNRLNLDSDGAFTVVNQEAQKTNLGFDRIDYVLRPGSSGPVWHLDLYDAGAPSGSLDIAAESGNIVANRMQRRPPTAPPPQTRDDRQYLSQNPVPPPPRSREYRDYPPDYYEDSYEDYPYERRDYRDDDDYRPSRPFGERVKNHFERRGRQIKRFFLGD